MLQNKRNCNLDLLKILCMLMVVISHTVGWGGLVEGVLVPFTYNWYFGNVLQAFSLQAVNCFVLISGYFLCTSKFQLRKLASLWVQTIFYSAGISVLLMVFNDNIGFSIKELIKSAMVFTMDRYWFVTDYILLYITFPFLNCAIKSMNKKMHLLCCCVLIGVFSVLSNIVYICDFAEVDGGYSYIWFCILYMIAAYIRLHVPQRIKHQKLMFPLYIITALCICGERFLANLITPYIFGGVRLSSLFYSYNSIVSIICALALFQAFRGLDIKSEKIGKISSKLVPLTFAVYLIHEQDLFRPVLWSFLKTESTYNKPYMVFYVLLCAISIFIACCLIELVRQLLFKQLRITSLINKTSDKIQEKLFGIFLNEG